MNYWKNRSLLKLADHPREAILDLLDHAAALKAAKKAGSETARLDFRENLDPYPLRL